MLRFFGFYDGLLTIAQGLRFRVWAFRGSGSLDALGLKRFRVRGVNPKA